MSECNNYSVISENTMKAKPACTFSLPGMKVLDNQIFWLVAARSALSIHSYKGQ